MVSHQRNRLNTSNRRLPSFVRFRPRSSGSPPPSRYVWMGVMPLDRADLTGARSAKRKHPGRTIPGCTLVSVSFRRPPLHRRWEHPRRLRRAPHHRCHCEWIHRRSCPNRPDAECRLHHLASCLRQQGGLVSGYAISVCVSRANQTVSRNHWTEGCTDDRE